MAPSFKENRFTRVTDRFGPGGRNSQSGPINPDKPPTDITRVYPELSSPLKALGGLKEVPDELRYQNDKELAPNLMLGVKEIVDVAVAVKEGWDKTAVADDLAMVRAAAREQLPAGRDYTIQITGAGTKKLEATIYPGKPGFGPGMGPADTHTVWERGTNKNPLFSPSVVVYGERKLHFARVQDGTSVTREPGDITRTGGEVPADARLDRGYPVSREPKGLA